MSIGDSEIKTQERVIRFFKDPEILGYQYIGNLSDYQNKNIKEDRLRQYLRLKGYADKLIDAAVMQLQQEAGNLSRGVYDANKTVYSRLKYGIPVSESPEKPPVTVELIDEANPLNNDFAIAEEVTVVEQQEKRPDLVIYLNGIAVAVIELKRSSISVSEGIRQNLTNQKDSFIRGFFNWLNGSFGIGGFYLCCVANYDAARAEVVFGRGNKQENKDAFDSLYTHKAEIESALGTTLQWNRGDDIKSSKVFIQLNNVSIENETDWLQMANFHADWTKKFYDVIVPFIKG